MRWCANVIITISGAISNEIVAGCHNLARLLQSREIVVLPQSEWDCDTEIARDCGISVKTLLKTVLWHVTSNAQCATSIRNAKGLSFYSTQGAQDQSRHFGVSSSQRDCGSSQSHLRLRQRSHNLSEIVRLRRLREIVKITFARSALDQIWFKTKTK